MNHPRLVLERDPGEIASHDDGFRPRRAAARAVAAARHHRDRRSRCCGNGSFGSFCDRLPLRHRRHDGDVREAPRGSSSDACSQVGRRWHGRWPAHARRVRAHRASRSFERGSNAGGRQRARSHPFEAGSRPAGRPTCDVRRNRDAEGRGAGCPRTVRPRLSVAPPAVDVRDRWRQVRSFRRRIVPMLLVRPIGPTICGRVPVIRASVRCAGEASSVPRGVAWSRGRLAATRPARRFPATIRLARFERLKATSRPSPRGGS